MVQSIHILCVVPIFLVGIPWKIFSVDLHVVKILHFNVRSYLEPDPIFCWLWFRVLRHWTSATKCNLLFINCNVFKCFENILAIFFKPISYSRKFIVLLTLFTCQLILKPDKLKDVHKSFLSHGSSKYCTSNVLICCPYFRNRYFSVSKSSSNQQHNKNTLFFRQDLHLSKLPFCSERHLHWNP